MSLDELDKFTMLMDELEKFTMLWISWISSLC